jgi:hypothetical protein
MVDTHTVEVVEVTLAEDTKEAAAVDTHQEEAVITKVVALTTEVVIRVVAAAAAINRDLIITTISRTTTAQEVRKTSRPLSARTLKWATASMVLLAPSLTVTKI